MVQNIKRMSEHSASLLLLLLLSSDFAFIVLYILNATPILNSTLFNLAGYGYARILEFIKLFWVVILLAYVLRSTRCLGYAAWILVFIYVFLEDAFYIHQSIGNYIARGLESYLPDDFGLGFWYFGELAVALAGLFLMIILVWAYWRGSLMFRKISKDLLLLSMALLFFIVFVDIVTGFRVGGVAKLVLEIFEEGGEMGVVSLIVWYVYLLAVRRGKLDLFLLDLLRKPAAKGSSLLLK